MHTDSARNGAKLRQRRIWCTSEGTRKAAPKGGFLGKLQEWRKAFYNVLLSSLYLELTFLSSRGSAARSFAQRAPGGYRKSCPPLSPYAAKQPRGARRAPPWGVGAERRGADPERRVRGEARKKLRQIGIWRDLRSF